MDKNYDAMSLISKHLYFKKVGEANFAAIIKNTIMVIKTTFKDSQKVKRISNYLLKYKSISVFLDITGLLISGEKMLMSAELMECFT